MPTMTLSLSRVKIEFGTLPSIVSTIIPTFTELKYTLFASILGCEVNELDDRIKLLTYLQLQDGGVGLMNSVDVSRSAYLASFA